MPKTRAKKGRNPQCQNTTTNREAHENLLPCPECVNLMKLGREETNTTMVQSHVSPMKVDIEPPSSQIRQLLHKVGLGIYRDIQLKPPSSQIRQLVAIDL